MKSLVSVLPFLFVLGLAGCSLAGLDRADLPLCVSDGDCAALAATVDDPMCETYVCLAETGQCAPARIDGDGDGDPPMACGGQDCDDGDAARFGAATEICNGIDDDCNGLLDGPDEDDDGDLSVDLCGGPAVTNDCDDDDAFTSFDSPELCDGLDNNCLLDGVRRQTGGARPEPSEDLDGDRHTAIGATICAAGPEGDTRFFPLDDCDDERADVFPGAREVCNGIDNDCDGIPDNAAGLTEPGTACRPHGLLAGSYNTCVWTGEEDVSKRELVCWGNSSGGRLGVVAEPPGGGAALVVSAAAGLSSVSLGGIGSCGLRTDGQVVCWGSSFLFGRQFLGNEGPHAPEIIDGVTDAVQVSAGSNHACALIVPDTTPPTTAGTVRCWGEASSTYIDGVSSGGDYSLAPTEVVGVSDVEEVRAGLSMTCARLTSGAVWCWGYNQDGRLGNGTNEFDAPPRPVVGIDDATGLYVGGGYACATRASGELWCWGGCYASGCNAIVSVAAPVAVTGTVVDVTLGGRHGCVLYDDGTIGCWGSNEFGQLVLNDPDVMTRLAPTLSPETGVLEVQAGELHTCVRREDGVQCWGSHSLFALGDGRDSNEDPAFAGFGGVPASVIANTMQIEGGESGTCFRLPNLRVVCTGLDDAPELGGGGALGSVPSLAFGPGAGYALVRDVALGSRRAMVVHQDGRVRTAGDGPAVGNADMITDAVDASCGEHHCCFVRATGEAACVGLATDEALGDGGMATETCQSNFRCSRMPLPVVGLERARSIAAGGKHTCVVRRDGEVACWGRNARGETGALPLGATRLATTVQGLPADDPARQLALSENASCTLLASGTVWCWGEGFGPNRSDYSVDPLPLPRAVNVAQIAAMDSGLCVRYRSGTVRCLGDNSAGQLGNGVMVDSEALVSVVGLTDARDIGCGPRHCCATRRSGQTVCWGDNENSTLGNGDRGNPPDDQPVPTPVASMLWSL